MYTDPSKIRKHTVKVRLNDEEDKLLTALVEYTGDQKAALLRDLMMAYGESLLEVPGPVRFRA